jgi:hypothetical protein
MDARTREMGDTITATNGNGIQANSSSPPLRIFLLIGATLGDANVRLS